MSGAGAQRTADAGWRERASGLIVPDEISREREVWSWSDVRNLNRVIAMLQAHHVTMLLRCEVLDCPERKLERLINPDGGFTLRCAHLDRVFTKAI